jgi:hypothetical protein
MLQVNLTRFCRLVGQSRRLSREPRHRLITRQRVTVAAELAISRSLAQRQFVRLPRLIDLNLIESIVAIRIVIRSPDT